MAHQQVASLIPDGCSDVATTITVLPGDGSVFTFEEGDFNRLGSIYQPGVTPRVIETVFVLDVTGDVLTIARGQQGTTAQEWGENAKIVCGISVSEYEDFDVVARSLQYAKGPLAAVDGTIPLMDGTSGRLLKASAHTPVTGGNSHNHAGGNGAVIPLSGMALLAANSFILNNTGNAATPIAGTVTQARALLGLATTDTPTFANVIAENLLTYSAASMIENLRWLTTTPANIKGLWLFNPVTGVVVTDRSGAAHTIDLSADASTLSPAIGGLARNVTFTAASWWDTVDHDDFSIAGPLPLTIIRLVKLSDATACSLCGKYDNTTGSVKAEYLWTFDDADKLRLRIYNGGGSSAWIGRTYNTALTGDQGAWHVYAATYSGGTTAAAIKIYRDGVRIDDADTNSGSYTGPTNTAAKLGSYAITTTGAKVSPFKGADAVCLFAKEEWTALQIERASRLLLGYAGTLI